MWPLSLFCSVYSPCGVQDVKGWPTRSSVSGQSGDSTGGLEREGEGIGCHIQMLQICSLPHMWIGTLLSGALLVRHEQSHRRGDKQAESEVTPSLNLLWYRITRFMSRSGLYPPILSQDLLVGKLGKPQMAVSRLDSQFQQNGGFIRHAFKAEPGAERDVKWREDRLIGHLQLSTQIIFLTLLLIWEKTYNVEVKYVLVYWYKTLLQKGEHHFGEVLPIITK